MAKVVELKDFPKELEKFTKLTLEQQKQGVVTGIMKSLPDLVAASPVDTGLYAQSWDFNVTESAVILGNYAPYAPIVEFGARPFTPPIYPLLAWAKRVLQDSSQPPSYSPRVWALARGTQNKIAQYGMQPRHVMTNLLPKIVANIVEELKKLG